MSATALESSYRALLRKGRLLANPGQAALVSRLAQLQLSLDHKEAEHGLQGLYIYGGVGTGKSYLADLFCSTLPSSVTRRRAHFHEFMLDIHARHHRARSAPGYSGDPIPKIGQEVRDESRVLCFDEFQVTDIADAMILQRLFSSFWADGGIMVSTSNRPPETLYENGLNRSTFLPFIALLKKNSELWAMEGTEDYRLLASNKREQTFFTDSKSFQAKVNAAKAGQIPSSRNIEVMMGRTLSVAATRAHDDVRGLIVYSSFQELCGRNLGAADYLALCRAAKTIFLDGLRRFRAKDLDFARRFITLIDTAYENGSRIFINSWDPLKVIFSEIAEAGERSSGVHTEMSVRKEGGSSSSMMSTFVSGDTEWSATGLREVSLATGGAGETDVSFAVRRALSRLCEMSSHAYRGNEAVAISP